MRFALLVGLTTLALGCSRQREAPMPAPLAVLPAPQDSALPTGKRARMWTAQRGWVDGYLIRFRPATDQQCLAVFAPSMSGALLVAEIDSLQVDEYRGFGLRPPTPQQIAAAPAPVWQAVSVPALRSRELHCDDTVGQWSRRG